MKVNLNLSVSWIDTDRLGQTMSLTAKTSRLNWLISLHKPDLVHSTDNNYSLNSADDFCPGCRNANHYSWQQSFSGIHYHMLSPGLNYLLYNSEKVTQIFIYRASHSHTEINNRVTSNRISNIQKDLDM